MFPRRWARVRDPQEYLHVSLLLRIPPHPRHEALDAAVLGGDEAGLALEGRFKKGRIVCLDAFQTKLIWNMIFQRETTVRFLCPW